MINDEGKRVNANAPANMVFGKILVQNSLSAVLYLHVWFSEKRDRIHLGEFGRMAIDIEVYYGKYMPMVLRRCRQMLKDEEDALDAAQDVFVRLLRGRQTLRGQFPSSLLYTIATNICLNRMRWNRRHAEDRREAMDEFGAAERAYEQVEAKMVLEAIFDAESESTRTICFMYHVDGMTLKEIGETLGLSISGVRKRLTAFGSRARIKYGDESFEGGKLI
jgi:RNA polymerase sigma-70 factor (ECF subfamily)